MSKSARKVLSVLLSICLVCLLTPFTAIGAEEQGGDEQQSNSMQENVAQTSDAQENDTQAGDTQAANALGVEGQGAALQAAGAEQGIKYQALKDSCDPKKKVEWTENTCTEYTVLTGGRDITLTAGWYVVNSDISIEGLTCKDGANIILCDGTTLTVNGIGVSTYDTKPAICCTGTVSFYAQTLDTAENAKSTMGALKVWAQGWAQSGISSQRQASRATINFYGGNVYAQGIDTQAAIGCADGDVTNFYGGFIEAQGGAGGAGIATGSDATKSYANIYGGTVVARGGAETSSRSTKYYGGAGIGSNGGKKSNVGSYASGCGVSIYGGTVTATGEKGSAGIGSSAYGVTGNINILGGAVTATGGEEAAGIGCGWQGAVSGITISGGTVTATGGKWGAGIGGSYNSDKNPVSDIAISGGSVTAQGGQYAAGIGGGEEGNAEGIAISGGTVDATGGEGGAGIGGGKNGTVSNVAISGSAAVTAKGGYQGAGIGGGSKGSGKGIAISGGTVSATGGEGGAGIGGGYKGSGNNLTITGGSVTATGGAEQGACIGGGDEGEASGIKITGGHVKAVRSNNGSAAIGGGRNCGCGNIIISNCYIEAQGGYWAPAIGTGCSCTGSSNSVTIENAVVKCYRGGGDGYPTIGLGPWANGATCKVTIGEGSKLWNMETAEVLAQGEADVTSRIGAFDTAVTNSTITAKGITTTLTGFAPGVSAEDQERISKMLSKVQVAPGGGFALLESQARTAEYILECTDEQLIGILNDPNITIDLSLDIQVQVVAADFSDASNPVIEYGLKTVGTAVYHDAARQMNVTKSRALDKSAFEAAKGTLAVTLPVPEGVSPKAVLHTSDDGEVVYEAFTEGGDATFTRDAAAGTLTCTITHCSHLVSSFEAQASGGSTTSEPKASASPATGDAVAPLAAVASAMAVAASAIALARRRGRH